MAPFDCPGGSQYKYLQSLPHIMSILLKQYKKFYIRQMAERVGIVIYGVMTWYLMGLASEAVIARNPKRRATRREKNNPGLDEKSPQHEIEDDSSDAKRSNGSDNTNDLQNNLLSTIEEESEDANEDLNDLQNSVLNVIEQESEDANEEGSEDGNENLNDLQNDLLCANQEESNEDGDCDPQEDGRFLDHLNHLNQTKTAAVEQQHQPFQDNFYDDLLNYNDDRNQLHLNHSGGLSCRDFWTYWPIIIFQAGYSAGAFDEGKEEASFCFQFWMKLRKTLYTRLPMLEIINVMDNKTMIKNAAPAANRKKSEYIEDTRFVMKDIHIDFTMLSLSPRLVPALEVAVAIMNNVIKDNSWSERLEDFFTFYSNGSFTVKCDINPNKKDDGIVISLNGQFDNKYPTKKCDYGEWAKKARELYKRALETATLHNDFLHLPNGSK